MTIKPLRASVFVTLLLLAWPAQAQEPVASETATAAEFDTSYSPSAALSYRVQRRFLDQVYRSAGPDMRAAFQAEFDARPFQQIWGDLVGGYGLSAGHVADALAAYWLLNWVVANAAFSAELSGPPVRQQLTIALGNDAAFAALDDDQRQAMAEGLMLDFLVLHTTMSSAIRTADSPALQKLARESVINFRRQYGVDLQALEPGPEGLMPRRRAAAPADGGN
jgi:hypothetical protein